MNGDEQMLLPTDADLVRLSRIGDDRKRKAFLRSRGLLREEVVLALNAATQKEFRVNLERARSMANAAVHVARGIRKRDLLAQSFRLEANVIAASGNYRASIRPYDSALKLFEKTGNQEGSARTLTAVIQPRIMIGDYEGAFEAANAARKIFVQLRDERRLARLENNIGNIYHRQERFKEALDHYELAYRSLLPFNDGEELTISLNNMLMCLIGMNDFARAVETYERAEKLLGNSSLPLIRLIADYNVAYLHYLRGNYGRAMEILKSSRKVGESIGSTYLSALCDLDLSDIYVELNRSSEAQEMARRAHSSFQQLSCGYEAARALTNQAISLGQSRNDERALKLFAEARLMFVQEKNEAWPWIIDLYRAFILFRNNRLSEARDLSTRAARFFAGSILKSKAVLCHLLLAWIAKRSSDSAEALVRCGRALDMLKNLDLPMLRYQSYLLLGELEQSRGNLSSALAVYQQARKDLENLRSSLDGDELKISFMNNRTEVYEHLVELCLKKESFEEAFEFMELAKSQTLRELMVKSSTEVRGAVSEENELDIKIRNLREELTWYQKRIELEQLRPEGNSEAKIEGLRREAAAREKHLLTLVTELLEAETNWAGTAVQNTHRPERVRSVLKANESLVEYFFVGEQIVAVVLTATDLEIVPVTTVQQISVPLRYLRFQLGRIQRDSKTEFPAEDSYQHTLSHLADLHKLLVLPIRRRLVTEHIVIVPHGLLHSIPFHALHDGENFLIQSHTVSYAPSAGVYSLCQTPRRSKGAGSLVLGIPDANAPLIQSEVESVRQSLPESDVFLGDEIDHRFFFEMAPRYQHIHVASHGIFRPDNPMLSGIRLSDGYLYLYELYRLRLSADLLVLSGCGTGLNVVSAGDELVGLMRGTLFAGARPVLLSLWEVSDDSTAQFMTSFYSWLTKSETRAEAFARATRDLMEKHPHPRFWAPFVLVGEALNTSATEFTKTEARGNFPQHSKPYEVRTGGKEGLDGNEKRRALQA